MGKLLLVIKRCGDLVEAFAIGAGIFRQEVHLCQEFVHYSLLSVRNVQQRLNRTYPPAQ
jgi:hypothetical protein